MNYFERIVQIVYYKNSVSYKLVQDFKSKMNLINLFRIIVILPVIPIWNFISKREIAIIKQKDSVYSIRDGRLLFYLPELNLRDGDYIQNRIFLERGYFDQRILNRVKPYVKRRGTVIDVGANIGNHTLFFCKECHAKKVYAFEPVKSTFALLERNISLNKLEDVVSIHNIALGDSPSKGNIIYAESRGGNRVEASTSGEVEIETLDNLKIEHIDFIKIDVEGLEDKVLVGAIETLRVNQPVIMIEIFDSRYKKVDSLLDSLGYQCKLRVNGSRDYIYRPKINSENK